MRHSHPKKDVPAKEQPSPADSGEAAKETPAETAAEQTAAEQAAETAYCPESEGADSACSRDVDAAEENAVPAPEEDPVAAKLADDLAKAQAELLKTKEAYLRSVAEFDNYRRRNNEEKPKLANYAKGDLAKDLFPVLDNFKLGLEAAEKQHPEAKSITEGFAMIAAQIQNALARHNIVEINPLGEPFDPNEQESLTSRPSDNVPEDHVLFVHRVGYKIGDRLLRPASVVISAGRK